MNIKKIRELLKLGKEFDVSEIEVRGISTKIRIVLKQKATSSLDFDYLVKQPITEEQTSSKSSVPEQPKAPSKKYHEIKSPIVGTFYRAPAPNAKPYVEVGDYIKKGQVLCIVEAMKVMNEIESDSDGKIVKILPDNEQAVQYNEVLFLVDTET